MPIEAPFCRYYGPESRSIVENSDASLHRSVYLPLLRGVIPRALEPFDPVTQTLVTGQRESTTVPAQALFLLNSGFVRHQSLSLATRLLAAQKADNERLREAYRQALSREPTPAELARGRDFLATYEQCCAAPKAPPASAVATVAAKVQEPVVPADPDNIDRTDYRLPDEQVLPASPREAAWMAFVQALYASAEFRFVR